MSELGGHALFLSYRDLQLGRGETVGDTAQVISRYVNCIMARVVSHSTLEELAEYSTVPVINALSDLEHPCQLLADLQTIREYKGRFEGLKFAWIGDGNNVCNSAILAAAITGMKMSVACPEGYEPDPDIVAKARGMGPYQINDALLNVARDDCMVMHCLPAHRGEEITSEVLTGTHSAVLDQAENRLHAQKALLIKLLGSK
jgi:ornithine carbamoyltransferase